MVSVPEAANVPTPRTAWSASGWHLRAWLDLHNVMMSEATQLYNSTQQKSDTPRLVLLGDSFVELLRGSRYGCLNHEAYEVPATFSKAIATRFPNVLRLGIVGDQAQHVLWRLADGELSAAMARDRDLVAFVHVGTNHLGVGHSAHEASNGTSEVARWLLENSLGHVVLSAVLPRFDATPAHKTWIHWPDWRPLVSEYNTLLRASTSRLERAYAGRVSYVDCGRAMGMWNASQRALQHVFMPFGVHVHVLGIPRVHLNARSFDHCVSFIWPSTIP